MTTAEQVSSEQGHPEMWLSHLLLKPPAKVAVFSVWLLTGSQVRPKPSDTRSVLVRFRV